ncbi:MAG: FAD-binding oxidoreductase [Spirochaetes bacterium]|nr:FAD-binding oxidoreductase [Spirochaetota bacterium]
MKNKSNHFDVIIIGSGSVGTPLAYYLALDKCRVLVIDQNASPGQGQNKRAIGGVRATHSEESKIMVAQKSIEILSSWQEKTGFNIEWRQGGYTFTAYNEADEKKLKETIAWQKKCGLNIEWYDKNDFLKIVPAINPNDLRGGSFSQEDGSASPLLAINSFYFSAKNAGAVFHFQEKVTRLLKQNNRIIGISTDQDTYYGEWVVNAAGAEAAHIGKLANLELPVYPDAHEGGVSEPVKRFLEPMVVDMRSGPESANFYFFQYERGQLLFCITPRPLLKGQMIEHTSRFLPQIARRMVQLMPCLAGISVRRIWRGLYPMTPDGLPIVGTVPNLEGYYNLAGMCGQGFMLGPGLGFYVSQDLTGKLDLSLKKILDHLKLERNFNQAEVFK